MAGSRITVGTPACDASDVEAALAEALAPFELGFTPGEADFAAGCDHGADHLAALSADTLLLSLPCHPEQ